MLCFLSRISKILQPARLFRSPLYSDLNTTPYWISFKPLTTNTVPITGFKQIWSSLVLTFPSSLSNSRIGFHKPAQGLVSLDSTVTWSQHILVPMHILGVFYWSFGELPKHKARLKVSLALKNRSYLEKKIWHGWPKMLNHLAWALDIVLSLGLKD